MTKYQKYLSYIGWASIAMAVIAALVSIFGNSVEGSIDINGQQVNTGTVKLVGAVIIAACYLILAWLCMRGAKDAKKAGPIRILSLIALVFSVIDLLNTGLTNVGSISDWISVIISGFTFFCANKVKKGE